MIQVNAVNEKMLPIEIILNNGKPLKFTKKAAVELRRKLKEALQEVEEIEILG